MDQERFDRLTRQLAQTPSRRGVLKGLGGGMMAGMLAAFGRSDALADVCKADGKPCKQGDQCCSGFCDGGTGTGSTGKSSGVCRNCTQDSNCSSGICQDGACVAPVTCPTGFEALNGGCFQTVSYSDGDLPECTNYCVVRRLVDGSDNYLCSSFRDTACSQTSDCPTGEACFNQSFCVAPC